jgi:chorismate mutase
MKKILFLLFFVISGLMIADDHKRMPADMQNKVWMAKLKMDLAELKGPPSLAELKIKRANRLADLDLLIDSGKYKGNALERLTSMRNRVLETNLPSQDQINQRHDRGLRVMKSKMRSRVKMMDKKFRDPRRERDMLEKERREMRKQRYKNRNKD